LSNSPLIPDKISDDAIVIKQYKSLINKLIPLQQENRLLEGLNKFSGRLPSRVRNIIKEEVIRLTSLTDASADNSQFAKFPVLKFKHFGIAMRLDKVGQEILQRETNRFSDRYTVGVFESVMNSEHYQSFIKQEQQEKIVKAFCVESQYFNDIDFGEDLAIRPNFTVFSPTFDKGKNCPLTSLSHKGMVVETKRTPVIETENSVFVFTFPKVAGFTDKQTDITYVLTDTNFNKESSVFETAFSLSPATPKKFIERLAKYVENTVNQFPLQRELEIERVMQNLERDRILANSPWIPLFLGQKDGQLQPLFELMTPTNLEYNNRYSNLKDLPTHNIFYNLIKELQVHKETFLLKGVLENKNQEVHVAATHRQLANNGLIKQFIQLATQSDKFSVIQYRLETVEASHKAVAFDIHDIIASEYADLSQITHILFCKDVTNWIGNLKIAQPEPLKPFPKVIIDDLSRWSIAIVMEDQTDRRAEARYLMNAPAIIKVGLFKQHEATLNDLSAHGLKLTLNKPGDINFEEQIKISVKVLKLSGQKYQIIKYDKTSGILHLKLPEQLVKTEGQKLRGLFSNNSEYFNQRDLSIRQRNIYRFLWELSIRNLPCASVLITNNRFTIDRLKTIYHKEESFDLQPFEVLGNEVPLHGFLADKDATGPKSQLLEDMLRKNQRDAHVVHVVRSNNKQIIYIKEQDFLFGNVRSQISSHVSKNAIEPFVTHLSAMRCTDPNTPLTSKRLAQISKLDLNIYTKINAMQKGYTHVLYITNVSLFHSVLLKFSIYPEAKNTTK
jgi:hypothetical protein